MTYHKWLSAWWWKNRIQYYAIRMVLFFINLAFRIVCWIFGKDYKTEKEKIWEEE